MYLVTGEVKYCTLGKELIHKSLLAAVAGKDLFHSLLYCTIVDGYVALGCPELYELENCL